MKNSGNGLERKIPGFPQLVQVSACTLQFIKRTIEVRKNICSGSSDGHPNFIEIAADVYGVFETLRELSKSIINLNKAIK
jgi:hypothetical protein